MIRPDSPSPAVAYETISSPSNGTAAPTGAGAGGSQLRPRGSNHVGMRQYNERVVLQAIRLHGELPKADLARLTRLSTQTISLIVNKLLDERLLVKREPLRGRIGQPSVPIALNPDGAYSVGVEIGRRDMDVLLIDFVGRVRHRARTQYAFPDPDRLFDTLAPMLGQALAIWRMSEERPKADLDREEGYRDRDLSRYRQGIARAQRSRAAGTRSTCRSAWPG